jgi:hypothetical protein
MPADKTKTKPAKCGACGSTEGPFSILITPLGANEVCACPACTAGLFLPAGFIHA